MKRSYRAALILKQKKSGKALLTADFCCFAGWEHPCRNNCLREKTMRKLIKYLIVNMAIFDFLILWQIQKLHRLLADRWSSWPGLMYGGSLRKASLRSCVYTGPAAGSDNSRSIWSCGLCFPFPNHQFKALLVLYSRHLHRRDGCTLPISLCRETLSISSRVAGSESLGRSLWRNFSKLLHVNFDHWIHFYPFAADIHTLHYRSFKAQVAEDSRRAIRVLKMAIAIVSGFAIC